MGHESPPTLPVAKPGGLRGDTREPRGGHPHKGGRRDRREVRAIPVRVSFVDEGPGSCAHVRTKKATPGESSGGRTLLSATQVSGLPARPPSLPKRRKDNPEIPPGFLVGLGQSHLSQKIPAATTRCVYLDHLLSVPSTWGSVLLVFVSYKRVAQVLFPSNKIRCLRRSKARLALRSRMASRERLQAERSSRSATVPSASEIPTKTSPTGFSSVPPSGPATPVTESP